MTELSRLISRLQKGIARNASYVKTIRHPQLLLLSLQELNELIGNDKVKDSVATQVSHLIMIKRRSMENSDVKEDEVMLNTVLYGPPGVGKTLVGAKLAKIWYSLGYLDGRRNARDKEQKIGDMLKDLFKDGVGGTSSDETAITMYVMFIFIMVFITIVSLAWSFYTKFGGMWTMVIIAIMLFFILIVGIYVSSVVNNNSDATNNKSNNKSNNSKNVKGTNEADVKNDASVNKNNEPVQNMGPSKQDNVVVPMQNFRIPSDDQIIKVVTRADFVDKYVGWSDKKTIKLLEENLGKVVFVDEAYSLVTDMHDSFGIEVLTTINLFLSQHSKEIIVIFAGYKDLMESSIFAVQPGLRRRFMWQFDCNGYDEQQLFDIFKMQLRKKGWGLTDDEATRALFDANSDAFPAFGGDTERLTFFSELEHSRDFISNETGMNINLLTPDHVTRGIATLRENNIEDAPEQESSNPLANMMKMFRGKKEAKKEPKKPLPKKQVPVVVPDSRVTEVTDETEETKTEATSKDPFQDTADSDLIEAVRASSNMRAYH
jgi:energy-coupling factor transporter transmembrane protein EcfT